MELAFIDSETGGLDPNTSALLEIGVVHWRDGRVLDALEILVQPEGLTVDPEALAVNHIDLPMHLAAALSRELAATTLRDWLLRHFPPGRISVAGHNVAFDLGFVRMLLGEPRYSWLFGHRTRDTMHAMRFLADARLLSERIVKLDDACSHFGIARARRHRALDDALATAELYGRLLALVKGKAA